MILQSLLTEKVKWHTFKGHCCWHLSTGWLPKTSSQHNTKS
jgi:hypothetical protein